MNKKKAKFKVGDVVCLNSGGPDMTVTDYYHENGGIFYTCRYWHAKKQEFTLLKYVEQDELSVAVKEEEPSANFWALP